jgi:hypothetical protein
VIGGLNAASRRKRKGTSMPKVTTHYYLDESGSSGDLARPGAAFDFGQQEVFTLACLGVDDPASLGAEIDRFASRNRVNKPDFKSSEVWTKPAVTGELVHCITAAELPSMMEVMDKRFMVSLNMVNTLIRPPLGECDTERDALFVRNAFADHIHAEPRRSSSTPSWPRAGHDRGTASAPPTLRCPNG